MFLTSGMLLTMVHLQSQPETSLSVVNYLYLVSWLGKPPLIILSMQSNTCKVCQCYCVFSVCILLPISISTELSLLIIEPLGGGGQEVYVNGCYWVPWFIVLITVRRCVLCCVSFICTLLLCAMCKNMKNHHKFLHRVFTKYDTK